MLKVFGANVTFETRVLS